MQGTNTTWAVVKKTDDDFKPLFTVKSKRIAYVTLELLDELEDDYEVVRLPDL